MNWANFFRDGGFGMFPTLIFGCALLGAALIYARKPEKRYVPLLVSLGVVTFCAGLAGFTTGVITTLRYVAEAPPVDQYNITLIGLAESANNLVLALIALVMAGIIASIGGVRVARTTRGTSPAPL